MTNLTQQPVVVEQEARDAAANYHDPDNESIGCSMREGRRDDHSLVQAFQRAILAERERAAKVCMFISGIIGAQHGSSIDSALREAADAIRSGKEPAA